MSVQVLQAYSPKHFKSLPRVEVAADKLARHGGLSSLELTLDALVRKHPSAINFGLQLLHRHSDIGDNEVMLAWQDTTIPVKVEEIATGDHVKIVPTVWGIDPTTDKFRPLEFALLEDGQVMPALDELMAADVATMLKDAGLDSLIGLAAIPMGQQPGAETTHGRANVVIPADRIKSLASFIEVVWAIDASKPTPLASGGIRPTTRACQLWCRYENGAHLGAEHIDHEDDEDN